MSVFEAKAKVISENCDCNFLMVWGGPWRSFWHGYTETQLIYGKTPMRNHRLRKPLIARKPLTGGY